MSSVSDRVLLLNLSRIGEVGGLRTFAEGFVQCFDGCQGVEVLVPASISIDSKLPRVDVPASLASSARVSRLRPIFWWLYSLLRFPASRSTKILCATHHAVPFRRHQVVVLHDLRPYFYPDTGIQRFNFHFLLPRSLRRCDGILTVSHASKDLIVNTYGIDPAKIFVIPQVVSAEFTPESKPRVGTPYLLTLGSTWPHKNVEELLRMHSCWAPKYNLKVVGGRGQYMESLQRQAAELGIQDRIEFLSELPKDEVISLLHGCEALVYPSVMEGFGLPPFEAMACGKPVILSDIPVFRELHGDLPLYVRLGDAQSWNDAIAGLETFDDTRRTAGIAHARSYTKDRLKRELFGALNAIWGEGTIPCMKEKGIE